MSVKINKDSIINGAKQIGYFVVPSSTVSLATGLVRLVVPPGVSVAVQGAMCLGGMILGRYLGWKVTDFVDEQIEDTVNGFSKLYTEIKKRTDVIQDKDLENEEAKQE